jgi:phospholipase/carboxylesterase
MMQMRDAQFGGLDCIVVRAHDAEPKLACILCHGFGATGEDLIGLADPLLQLCGDRREEVALVFPAAVMSLDDRGLPGGRAWWWIDLDRLLNNPTPETLRGFRCDRPEGMKEASEKLQQAVQAIQQEWKLTPEQTILGGFSQGSMIAVDAALSLSTPPAGLIIYSGALICEKEWSAAASRLASTKIIQSHGRHDPILHISQGRALKDMLTTAGCTPKYLDFAGQHEIHPAAIMATAELIKSLLS